MAQLVRDRGVEEPQRRGEASTVGGGVEEAVDRPERPGSDGSGSGSSSSGGGGVVGGQEGGHGLGGHGDEEEGRLRSVVEGVAG